MFLLAGLAPETIRPAALTLNILVAAIASYRFGRAGLIDWKLLWPFALASIPFALLGGLLTVPVTVFKVLVGLALFVAAIRLLVNLREREVRPVSNAAAAVWGAAIGVTSGLTGVGGGIYLSPLLILCGWANVRTAAGVSALFILLNSIAGLAGQAAKGFQLPTELPIWAVAAVVGGLVGSHLGTRALPMPWLRRALALVLIIAAGKLALS